MTRQGLRVYLQGWFCGCGDPYSAAGALLKLLALHPLHESKSQSELNRWITDYGVIYLLLYKLDSDELTEHGGTVAGAWLTDKGKAVLEALSVEAHNDFQDLLSPSCIHGYDFEDTTHSCEEYS